MRISDWSSDVCSSDLAEAQRCRKRSVEDGERTRCAAEQDRLGQGAMDGREESADRRVRIEVRHQTSAPPPNEKNDRKKELAANAIDRPNTIWMSLRAPPLLSAKATVRPVRGEVRRVGKECGRKGRGA